MLTNYCTIARCWGHHARHARYDSVCEKLIMDFLNKYENLQHSMAFNNTISPVGIDTEQLTPDLRVSSLHVASYFGLTKIVENLLSAGAAANATTSFGTTALHIAQNEEIATLLLESGVQIDYPDGDGRTLLMHHAWDDDVVVVKKLLDSGANIKATCKVGYTPFHEVSSISISCSLLLSPTIEPVGIFLEPK